MPAPRKYDRVKLVPAICDRLAEGEPLAVIRRDLGIPARTINQWRQDDAEIAAQFDQARDDGWDAIAHRTRATARGKGESTKDVQRDKLIIENDHKLLAKWDPRRYGDRMTLAGDRHNPLVPSARALTDEQLLAIASAVSTPLDKSDG